MAHILLLLDHEENRHRLESWLAPTHQWVAPTDPNGSLRDTGALDAPFDLAIIDTPALQRLWAGIQARKAAAQPVLLPFLLVTPRADVDLSRGDLAGMVDSVVVVPVHKAALQAQVEVLLRMRRLSLELKARNDDLETFVHAMSHDLHAPARIAAGFAEALAEDYGSRLDGRGHHYLDRIRASALRMQKLLDLLRDFAYLGRQRLYMAPVPLQPLVAEILSGLQEVIEAEGAEVVVDENLPIVRADRDLLGLALENLLTNALKFVAPGTRPEVRFGAEVEDGRCRIEVQDNGIGVPVDEQVRIFEPLVRLYGEESYAGSGLGLSIMQRVVELMGGDVGVDSSGAQGSTFWICLDVVEESVA